MDATFGCNFRMQFWMQFLDAILGCNFRCNFRMQFWMDFRMQFRIALWGVVIDHNFDRGHRANFRIAISDRCPASLRAIEKIKILMDNSIFWGHTIQTGANHSDSFICFSSRCCVGSVSGLGLKRSMVSFVRGPCRVCRGSCCGSRRSLCFLSQPCLAPHYWSLEAALP